MAQMSRLGNFRLHRSMPNAGNAPNLCGRAGEAETSLHPHTAPPTDRRDEDGMRHKIFFRRVSSTIGAAGGAWIACLLAILAAFGSPAAAAPTPCAELARTPLARGAVTSVQELTDGLPKADVPPSRGPDGPYVDPAFSDLPRFCRLSATLSPVAGSRIGIEIWMPDRWNGKLLAIGNHGFGGEFERADMAMGLHRGYAVAATDAGHSAPYTTAGGFSVGDARFAMQGGAVAVDDYSWRAVHEMTVAAKAIVARRYGAPARRAYFDGCSKGGGQAMREAQQFPADYDGIISGSAAMYATRLMASDLWASRLGDLGGGLRITPAKLQLAQKAATAACDGLDGLVDGVVADVRRCAWRPAELRCKAGQDPGACLTDAEVSAVTRAEEPLRDPATGAWLYDGFAAGSEARWISPLGNMGAPNPVTDAYFRYMVTGDPNWSASTADPIELLRRSEDPKSALSRSNAVDPNLSGFRRRGGKMIQYHGWSDEAMVPGFAPRYYMEVVDMQPGEDRLGRTQSFYRLFMVPGMGHCAGGSAPVNFGGLAQAPSPTVDGDHDVLEALDRWVEHGSAPERLIATSYPGSGAKPRQMPLCPFPAVATYVGGEIAAASSFTCKSPLQKEPQPSR